MQHSSNLLRVLPNRLPEFGILYSGFEKNLQQKIEIIVSDNKKIFEKFLALPNFCSAHNDPAKITIQVMHLHVDSNFNYRYLQTGNACVLCVGDFDNFETVIEWIRKGFGGCVSYRDLLKEIVPAIISVLQHKIYVSPSFFPILYDDLKIPDVELVTHRQLFTRREKNLIQLLTTGALYKEIASKLQISENTVRSHIRNIYSKLKVHSKTELTMKIMSGKIISSLTCFLANCLDDIAYLCY